MAGPEAANNASAAGVLVPMLTLGLPTSATAAIMLSAFQSYGINPGPLLLQNQSQLVWGLIASLFIGNFLLLALNLPMIRIWVKMLQVPAPMLYAGILVFATIGTYGISQSPVDLALLYIVGGMGYLMRRYDFPTAPVIIGMILGPLAEQNFPSGHDDFRRRLDRVLHTSAFGDNPCDCGARTIRTQDLRACDRTEGRGLIRPADRLHPYLQKLRISR